MYRHLIYDIFFSNSSLNLHLMSSVLKLHIDDRASVEKLSKHLDFSSHFLLAKIQDTFKKVYAMTAKRKLSFVETFLIKGVPPIHMRKSPPLKYNESE